MRRKTKTKNETEVHIESQESRSIVRKLSQAVFQIQMSRYDKIPVHFYSEKRMLDKLRQTAVDSRELNHRYHPT